MGIIQPSYAFPEPFYPSSLRAGGKDPDISLPEELPALPLYPIAASVDASDAQTPDNWVKRDENLVRLTGKHPFNCEAKLDTLFKAGFLTPTSLFYVRNHGAVPKVDEATAKAWRLRIHGLVENEVTLSIQDLASLFQVVTLPITLVCAGNRRKEQNMVRKGLGFNWGAAGVSTALFTGVYLADVLDHVQPLRKAKHVIFEGTDSLPNGPYGTSQKLSWAATWAMNGLPLEPDHGFPLRVVIPGQIGGRSVKWLARIEISDQESQHHLHFWDNKVLPTQVLPEQARAEKHWWYDPRAIAQPAHEEVLQVPTNTDAKYLIKGYAYAGGGRRVSRVELSLDEGTTWVLTDIVYPEDAYRAVCYSNPVFGTLDLTDRDTCFCWCFWSLEVKIHELKDSPIIMVRAMDEGMCVQQADMYWNATGMMNNWYFRVAVNKKVSDRGTDLVFEHPTMAGVVPGGWMERYKASKRDYLKPVFGSQPVVQEHPTAEVAPLKVFNDMVNPLINRNITMEELKAQDRNNPWFVVNDQVYDGTAFLTDHPGGPDSILLVAGEDATDDFVAIHSPEAREKMIKYHIGTLVNSSTNPTEPTETDSVVDPDSPFLHKSTWKDVILTSITDISSDSRIYRFALDQPDRPLGLPVGQHVFVRLKRKNGDVVQRAYTPVSLQDVKGSIDFLIKIYFPSSEFPEGGKMTMGFHELSVGDTVQIKGPIGSFVWEGNGVAKWRGVPRNARNLGLVCAGSGITPVLQVLRSVLHDQNDSKTKLWLLDANRTEQDILCREELDKLALLHGSPPLGGRFLVHYTLSKPKATADWSFSTGRINESMLRMHLPSPDMSDALILICGPDKLIKDVVQPGLEKIGWDTSKTLVIF
ncbi:hypothetical protein M408DRAFT_64449 [Serendipita vermifera MAFF 305830]|uniref:Nitrate reductase [NADPH] n=1 Tax=Serendipita vermifera MAFF 305830 TaxID=933852 RepID=A0A0C3B587_SERVB|nr:hypothetical protein M408DRAFT_64449 [Serendipita vermifera MAFF 305830]